MGVGFGPKVHKRTLDVLVNDGFEHRVDANENISYEGIAKIHTLDSEPLWRISRTVRQLDGSLSTSFAAPSFSSVWDDRVSYFPPVTPITFFNHPYENLIPLLENANWMQLASFDKIEPTFSVDTATLSYYESDAIIGQALFRYVDRLNWDISLIRYLNAEDGEWLLAEDDTPLNLG